jgi:hypothetical protein
MLLQKSLKRRKRRFLKLIKKLNSKVRLKMKKLRILYMIQL